MLLLQIFFAALLFSFWYSSYILLCIKIVSQLLNVLLYYYFSILFFCLCISTLYVVLFSYSNLPIISWEIYLCVVNKYLFFISVAVFFLIPGDLPNPGIELSSLESPALAGRVFITVPPGIPLISKTCVFFFFFFFFLSFLKPPSPCLHNSTFLHGVCLFH